MEPVLLTEGFPTVCLYPATSPERPLIVLNSFAEEGDRVAEACSDLDLSLLILRDLHWDDDLSPWPAPALSKKDPPFSGGADAHLARIRDLGVLSCYRKSFRPVAEILAARDGKFSDDILLCGKDAELF